MQNGYGLDAQWSDDFHHALHALLTGTDIGYYQDFGACEDLAKAYRETFVYDWKYAPHRSRFHGAPAIEGAMTQFVVCIQNHDQIGNQMKGERLSQLISFEGLKLAAGAIILSPYIPLLFMGEEYGEEVPFTYFVSHSDPELIQMVRQGRKQEFKHFHYDGEPPDPGICRNVSVLHFAMGTTTGREIQNVMAVLSAVVRNASIAACLSESRSQFDFSLCG